MEHLHAGQSFVVAVPDGELGVRGTRFIVEVSKGHTDRVLVTEGSVALRLSGSQERTLAAGESWSRPRSASSTPPGSELLVDVASEAAPGRGASSVKDEQPPGHRQSSVVTGPEHGREGSRRLLAPSAREREPAPPAEPSSEGAASHASSPEGSEPRSASGETPAHEFAAAMASLDSGAYLEADERLVVFAAHFPSDGRREDAAFLRAVIALDRGDPAAAVARARDYLKTFPHGLRRIEMERITRSAQ